MEPFERVQRFLIAVRRELNRISSREAALGALLCVVLAALVTLAAALTLGEAHGFWAWGMLLAGLCGAGVLVWRWWVVPRRRRAADDQLALWIEARGAGFHSSLVTSVQTAVLLRAPHGDLGFSPALALSSAHLAAARVKELPVRSFGDRRRLARVALALGGLLLLAGLVALVAPSFYVEGARALVAAAERPGAGDDRVESAVVGQLNLEITEPAYTGTSPRHVEGSSGDVEVLRGSEVRFAGRALFPAKEAALILESNPTAHWKLDLGADGTVSGSFRVGQSDRYQFQLVGKGGQAISERAWRVVNARADAAPEVALLLPDADLEVKPDDAIAFFFEASDDYGLDRVELVVADDDGRELERTVVGTPNGERIARGDSTVSIAGLGLEPGDAVEVWFEAADFNELDGPGKGKSQSRRLSLYSPEAEHDELLAKLDALIDAMVDVLADRLESPIEAQDRFRILEYVALGQRISTATEQVVNELTTLSTALSTDTLASDELRTAVQEVRDRLRDSYEQEAAHLRKAVLGETTVDAQVMVALLYGANEEAGNETETGILRLKDVLDASRAENVLDAARELLETQNEMAELLKKLKDTKDPEALKAAMKKLRKLQDKLQKLQEQLAKLREKVPYENQNAAQRPSDKALSMKDMASTMDQIQKLLEEGKIDEAMKLLEELNKSTQELMAGLQDDLDTGGGLSPRAQQMAQELRSKLDELADGQRGVKGETSELERQVAAEEAKRRREEQQAALDELAEQAAEVGRHLEKVPEEPLHPADKDSLEGLKKDARAMQDAIKAGNLGKAAELAEKMAKGSGQLGDEVGKAAEHEPDEGRHEQLREGKGEVGQASEKAGELAEKLAEMMKGSGQAAGPEQSAESQRLGQRQGQLKDQLQKLREGLGELDKEMPGVQGELGEPLQQAGEAMKEAEQSLGEGKPGDARRQQQDALERLEQAQQQMKERMQQQRRPGGKEDGSGVVDPHAKVEIPKDDPYAGPKNFREEVLRAMKERAPETYKGAIEKFYEELLK